MDFNWKRAVKDAQRHGCASSGALSGFHRIRFYLDGNRLMMTTMSGSTKEIDTLNDLAVRTVHFLPADKATYTQLNAHDTTVIEELTQAVIRGEIRIAGTYSCVNNLGSQPLPNAKSLTPIVPFPIKIRHGDEYYIKTGQVKVTRGAASWYIHTGHIESITTEGSGRTRMETNRVYMCGNSTPQPAEQGVWTYADEFGSLNTLPPDLVHDRQQLSKVVLEDFNNLPDIHLKQIVVEDYRGRFGMNAIFTPDLESNLELRFLHNGTLLSRTLQLGARYMDASIRPYICVGPEGLPDIVVFSETEVKRRYCIVKALATNNMLLGRVHRLQEALPRYLKTFPNANLEQISRAFGSSPLGFVTHISRLRTDEMFDTPFKGHLSHTFLSPSTKTPAVHVPAYSRKDLEGYTLVSLGSYDISLVQGRRVTYIYDENSSMYNVTLSELGQARIPPDALVS